MILCYSHLPTLLFTAPSVLPCHHHRNTIFATDTVNPTNLVTICGTNFSEGATPTGWTGSFTVNVGNQPATIVQRNDTFLVIQLPAFVGAHNPVTVDPNTGIALTAPFTVTYPGNFLFFKS
jgi:hypothetical protein